MLQRALFACLLALLAAAALARPGSALPRFGPAPSWVVPISPQSRAVEPVGQVDGGMHVLLSDHQVRVAGTQQQSFHHIASKALTEKGVETAANIEIPFDPSYQTLTIHRVVLHRDGQTHSRLSPAKVHVLQREKDLEYLIFDGRKTAHLFLDDVRVGDVVEYDYSLSGTNPVFGSRRFGQFSLQISAPVHRTHLRLLWADPRPLRLHLRNGAGPGQVRQLGDAREHVWDIRDDPGRSYLSETPGWFDLRPRVAWGDFADWAEVAQWAVPLYEPPRKVTGELDDAIRRIAREHAAPALRAAEALRFVQRSVRYLGVEVGPGSHAPNPPALVLARRFGDCKDKVLLTLTMLRALGIEAHAALVHTTVRRGLVDAAPSPGAFDHVIVRARIDGRDHWLDPTRPQQTGTLDTLVQPAFGQALVVNSATRGLQEIPIADSAIYRRKVRAVFDASAGIDAPALLTITTVAQGAEAESLRRELANSSAQDLQKGYQNFYVRDYPGLSVETPLTIEDEAAANRLTVVERYRIPGFWVHNAKSRRTEARIEFPEVLSYLKYPKTRVRDQPYAVRHPVSAELVTELRLPEDWPEDPETQTIDDPAFRFEHTLEATPRVKTFVDRYESRADQVASSATAAYVANIERARNLVAYTAYKEDPVAQPAPKPRDFPAPGQLLLWGLAALGAMQLLRWIWPSSARRVPTAAGDPPPPQPARHADTALTATEPKRDRRPRWRDLPLAPGRFFQHGPPRITGIWMVMLVLAVGAACASTLTDLLQALREWDPQRSATRVPTDWITYWGVLALMLPLGVALSWFIGAWFYWERLHWSGAATASLHDARRVYLLQDGVFAAPMLLTLLACTVVLPNSDWGSAPRATQVGLALWTMAAYLWSCHCSHVAARTVFAIRPRKGFFWFFVLPAAVYAVLFAVEIHAILRQ